VDFACLIDMLVEVKKLTGLNPKDPAGLKNLKGKRQDRVGA
jgi:hypothetical protein